MCCPFQHKKIRMACLDSYHAATTIYGNWATEREQVIRELKTLRDEIQRINKIYATGSVAYSSVGVAGGAAVVVGVLATPLTFGASLFLVGAGTAAGVASGVAGAVHSIAEENIVTNLCETAKQVLDKHAKTCKGLTNILLELEREICDDEADEWADRAKDHLKKGKKAVKLLRRARLPNGGRRAVDFVPRAFRRALMNNVRNPALRGGALAVGRVVARGMFVVSSLAEAFFLAQAAVDLHNLNKGQLCTQAQNLQEVIDELQKEYDELKDMFQET